MVAPGSGASGSACGVRSNKSAAVAPSARGVRGGEPSAGAHSGTSAEGAEAPAPSGRPVGDLLGELTRQQRGRHVLRSNDNVRSIAGSDCCALD
eukprot:3599446-Alexandrium_andersonii.AAC.1